MWYAILARWKQLDWMPPLPNLDRHLEHIAGGALMVLAFLSFGFPWLTSALIATGVALLVEGLTAMIKKNWSDSAFDFVQYCFHWALFFVHNAWWIFAASYLILWLAVYIYMLLEEW